MEHPEKQLDILIKHAELKKQARFCLGAKISSERYASDKVKWDSLEASRWNTLQMG